MIIQNPKLFKNRNTVDIKPVTTEDPKASHKLSKSIRQAKKVSQVGYDQTSNSLLYNDAKK